MKGPRTYDSSGIPLHKDSKTVIKERISLDKSNPDILHNEITTIDNALTRPWTVTQDLSPRAAATQPSGRNTSAPRTTATSQIGDENYVMSADGHLMPARKASRRRI